MASKTDWSVLLYGNASGLGVQMLNSLAQAATRIRSETTNVMAHCQYGNGQAWRFKVSEGVVKVKKHIDWVDTINGDHTLVEAFRDLKKKYPARHYAIVLMGFGSGTIDLIWDKQEQCWQWPTNHTARGILYDPDTGSQLSTAQLINACRRIHEEELKNQKLDVLITDACAMNSVELLSELSNDVAYFCGTQDEQPLNGLPYHDIFNLLNMQQLSPAKLVSGIVDAFKQHYSLFGPGHPVTYSGFDLNRLEEIHDIFVIAMTLLHDMLQQAASDELRTYLFEQRNLTTESLAFTDYVDLYAWLTGINELLHSIGDLVPNDLRQQYTQQMRRLRIALHGYDDGSGSSGLVVNHCALLRDRPTFGMNIYYPRLWSKSIENAETHDAWVQFMQESSRYLGG